MGAPEADRDQDKEFKDQLRELTHAVLGVPVAGEGRVGGLLNELRELKANLNRIIAAVIGGNALGAVIVAYLARKGG